MLIMEKLLLNGLCALCANDLETTWKQNTYKQVDPSCDYKTRRINNELLKKYDESIAIKDADKGGTIGKCTLYIMSKWFRNNLKIRYI